MGEKRIFLDPIMVVRNGNKIHKGDGKRKINGSAYGCWGMETKLLGIPLNCVDANIPRSNYGCRSFAHRLRVERARRTGSARVPK